MISVRIAAATSVFWIGLAAATPGALGVRAGGAGRETIPREGHLPTRVELQAARRKVDRLECEAALGAARKPYLVLDLDGKKLLFRLMGMTMREILIEDFDARGLLPAPGASSAGTPASLAGIFTLHQKEGDPRLAPLTPAQIEAGLDDENAVDALPPETPANYALAFKERLSVRVVGSPTRGGAGGILASLSSFWRSLLARGADEGGRPAVLRISLRLDEAAARELYRALVPEERFLILPAVGLVLPDAGQALPRSIRAARPAPRPTSPVTQIPSGVPFRIPPPVDIDQGTSSAPAVPLQPAAQPTPTPEPNPAPPASETPGDAGGSAPPPGDAAQPRPPGATPG